MTMNSNNPLHDIVTTPEPTTTEKRKQGAMLGAASMILMPHKGVLGFFKKLTKGVVGKIAFGVLCAMIAGSIKDMPAIWHAGKVVCSFIGALGDDKITKAIPVVLGKAGGVITEQTEPASDTEEEKLGSKQKERANGFVTKAKNATKQMAHDTGEAVAKKVKPIENDARRAVDEIKDRLPQTQAFPPPPLPPAGISEATLGTGMGGGPLQPIAPPQTFIGRAGNVISNTGNQIGQYALEKQKLIQRQVDNDRPMREAYAEWWVGHMNASCPWCRKPMHVVPSAHKLRFCDHCHRQFSPATARNNPPPLPQVIPVQFAVEWKKKHPEPTP